MIDRCVAQEDDPPIEAAMRTDVVETGLVRESCPLPRKPVFFVASGPFRGVKVFLFRFLESLRFPRIFE